jgi:DNA-binding transcriptional regulator GbsR (MarR family)
MNNEELETLRELQELRDKIIDAIADTMDLYGAAHSIGRLYGIMWFEGKPFTLDELKERMGMSKSNMSYAVRTLMQSRMVEKLPERVGRKELVKAEPDFFQAFQNFFTDKLQREIRVMRDAIDDVLPRLQEIILSLDTNEKTRLLALRDWHKLSHAIEYYKWLQSFVDLVKSGEIFRLVTIPNQENEQ